MESISDYEYSRESEMVLFNLSLDNLEYVPGNMYNFNLYLIYLNNYWPVVSIDWC
jgi:hypothetical protein